MRFFLTLGLLFVLGCGVPERSDPEEALDNLPANAKILEDLGRNWFVVEIKIQGQTKRFLYHHWNESHTSERATTLTELKD